VLGFDGEDERERRSMRIDFGGVPSLLITPKKTTSRGATGFVVPM
jgi:hypothetical protein